MQVDELGLLKQLFYRQLNEQEFEGCIATFSQIDALMKKMLSQPNLSENEVVSLRGLARWIEQAVVELASYKEQIKNGIEMYSQVKSDRITKAYTKYK